MKKRYLIVRQLSSRGSYVWWAYRKIIFLPRSLFIVYGTCSAISSKHCIDNLMKVIKEKKNCVVDEVTI